MWLSTQSSTIDHIFCIRQILGKKRVYNEEVHQLFIDFKKAYGSVTREILYKILIEFGIPRKLVRLIKMSLTEIYSRVWVGKNLFDRYPIRNGLKEGDALSPMLFNFPLEYAIRRVQVNQDGLKLNCTRQLLAYADDINILGGSIHTLKKNAEVLIAATREIGLEVSAVKLSTWSCLEIRMQDEFTVLGWIIVPSRGWKSLNIWEQL